MAQAKDITLNVPLKLQPFLRPKRLKGAFGGRGGGKSRNVGDILLIKAIENPKKPLRIVCAREFQNSITDSVKALLDDSIKRMGLEGYYKSTLTEITAYNGSVFKFVGLRRNSDNIKSLEGADYCWVEEANVISSDSLEILLPTIRKEGSEIWFTYNRKEEEEPVHELLKTRDGIDAILIEINYDDNPHFPDTLRAEMEFDRNHDQGKFEHVWLGKPKVYSKAQVFHGKYRIEIFDTPSDALLRFGSDFGFSDDPATLIRYWLDDNKAKGVRRMYIDYEAYEHGVELDELPAFYKTIPESDKWPIIADSSRPDTISYIRRHGFPKIRGAKKGANSIEDGVEWIKSFEIIIHPRCKHVADEFRLYSYKTNKMGDVLPVIEDKNNHCIDPIRYAGEDARIGKRKMLVN
jgi:phage terminase large subunit